MAGDDRFSAIADTILDACIEQAADGCISDWNSQAERLWGGDAAQAIGMPSHQLMPTRTRERHDRALAALATPARVRSEAHALQQGAAGNIAAPAVCKAAGALEPASEAEGIGEVEAVLGQLSLEVDRRLEHLRRTTPSGAGCES